MTRTYYQWSLISERLAHAGFGATPLASRIRAAINTDRFPHHEKPMVLALSGEECLIVERLGQLAAGCMPTVPASTLDGDAGPATAEAADAFVRGHRRSKPR